MIAASGGCGAGPFAGLSRNDLQAGFNGKFWAHWNAAQAAPGYLRIHRNRSSDAIIMQQGQAQLGLASDSPSRATKA
jgi:hypothetical protein